MRRGWVWAIRPRPARRQIFGSWVVLPAGLAGQHHHLMPLDVEQLLRGRPPPAVRADSRWWYRLQPRLDQLDEASMLPEFRPAAGRPAWRPPDGWRCARSSASSSIRSLARQCASRARLHRGRMTAQLAEARWAAGWASTTAHRARLIRGGRGDGAEAANLRLQFVGQLRMLVQILGGVGLALTDALTAVAVPGARFFDQILAARPCRPDFSTMPAFTPRSMISPNFDTPSPYMISNSTCLNGGATLFFTTLTRV